MATKSSGTLWPARVALLTLALGVWGFPGEALAAPVEPSPDAGLASEPAVEGFDSDGGIRDAVESPVAEPPPPADLGGPEPGITPIEDLNLDELLELPTVSSTKVEVRSGLAPAVITVVTAEEIRIRGYTSLADALRVVPGFYDVYDLVTHNVGVRGINGGARASGNVVKLMIDGYPVDFRPTTGNFFGEELIPLSLVDRVEIIRGPASALYGANAFLGVINVITKRGADLPGVQLTLRGALTHGHPGGGFGLTTGASGEFHDFLLGAEYLYLNRSGLSAPATSPVDFSGRGASSDDFLRARAIYGKAALNRVLGGRLTVSATVQALDARAEFLDFYPLTHQTRMGWLNQTYRGTWEIDLGERASLSLSGHLTNAAPSASEQIDVGRRDSLLLRSVGATSLGLAAEARLRPLHWLALVGGADFESERHQRQTFAQLLTEDVLSPGGAVIRSAGTIIPGTGSGQLAQLLNGGAYVQGIVEAGGSFTGTAGLRLDAHNLYRTNLSTRVALVYSPPGRPLSIKALFGTSFKAPSAVQLYTQPMEVLDVKGNAALKPQLARTGELAALTALPWDLGEATVSLFVTSISGRVEFQQSGLYLEAQNLFDEWVVGAELQSRLRLTETVRLHLSGGVARSVAQTGQSLIGKPVANALFPLAQVHAVAEYRPTFFSGLVGSLELSWIGPRPASQSNALLAGREYELAGYLFTAAAVAWDRPLWGDRPTRIAVRATNLLARRWEEPGFAGLDVPAQGPSVILTLTQGL